MIKVEFENFSEYARKLNSKNLAKAVGKGFSLAGHLIKKSVSVETPVRTGNLQRGWRMKVGNLFVEIYDKVKYGPFVNYGTRYIRANPFMERGYEKVKGQVRFLVYSELRKELYK